MNYTDQAAVASYLNKDIASSFGTSLTSHIAAMSGYIDEAIGYPLHRTEETERKYDGNGRGRMKIDPVHTISEVTVDGTTVTPLEWPYNSDTKTQLVQQVAHFPTGLANVSVTGVHCLKKTLPEQIKWACTVLVALTVQQVDEQREGVQSEKIGDYSVTYQDQKQRGDLIRAKEIIHSFRPIVF